MQAVVTLFEKWRPAIRNQFSDDDAMLSALMRTLRNLVNRSVPGRSAGMVVGAYCADVRLPSFLRGTSTRCCDAAATLLMPRRLWCVGAVRWGVSALVSFVC